MSREDDFDDIIGSDETDAGQDDTSETLLDLDSVDESTDEAETEQIAASEAIEAVVVEDAPPQKPAARKKKK